MGAHTASAIRRTDQAASVQDVPFHIQLLGRVRASWRGRELRFGSRNASGLLALLALRPRGRPRASIAADLWPDGNGSSAAALRQALWLLRSALTDAGGNPDVLLDVEDEAIGLRSSVGFDLDTVRFEALVQSRPSQPLKAVALYHGELAEGLDQECFARERERLADLFEDALADVAAALLDSDELHAARLAALRLIGLDPLREEAHAVLIEIYGRSGSRSQVTRQYRRLRALLDDELGVEPLPETEAVYRSALSRSWLTSARRQVLTTLRPSLGPDETPTRMGDGLID